MQEAARKAEEERLAREAAEAAAADAVREEKKQREKDKKLVRKERQRLRAAAGDVAGAATGFTPEELEELLTGFDLAGLRRVCEEVEGQGSAEGKVAALRRALQRLKDPTAVHEEPAAAGPSAAAPAEPKGKASGTAGKGEW